MGQDTGTWKGEQNAQREQAVSENLT